MMGLLTVDHQTVGLVLNVPEVFQREDFRRWLNSKGCQVATWHVKGKTPGEYSDTFLLVDSNYEGCSSDMPEDVWLSICNTVYSKLSDGDPNLPGLGYHVSVRLTNLDRMTEAA